MPNRNPRPDEEVSVVFTAQIQVLDIGDDAFVEVPQIMHTGFYGPRAHARAESFMRSERDRDFVEADGWQWWVRSNKAASDSYLLEMFEFDDDAS